METYSVYILTSENHECLYIGVTSDLTSRLWEHKHHFYKKSFTAKYHIHQLLYYEDYNRIEDAIAREKQLKNWQRQWKIDLINTTNPQWHDLALDWYDDENEGLIL